ncbi:MAG: DNA/RNA nuclease SfsA [Pseudomonadota bacterium]
MNLQDSLQRGTLIRRYKRFLADITLDDGTEITAHCPNSGAMMGLNMPGLVVYVSESDSKTRKYPHTLEIVQLDDGTMVGINTSHPNTIVQEAIESGTLPSLSGYATLRREVRYGENSRIDILLESDDAPRCYVEVKNVHLLRKPRLAEFPDSVTTRGAKHLRELADQVATGARAVMVYLIQREDVDNFAFAADIDPGYTEAYLKAIAAGVESVAIRCCVERERIVAKHIVPVIHPSSSSP